MAFLAEGGVEAALFLFPPEFPVCSPVHIARSIQTRSRPLGAPPGPRSARKGPTQPFFVCTSRNDQYRKRSGSSPTIQLTAKPLMASRAAVSVRAAGRRVILPVLRKTRPLRKRIRGRFFLKFFERTSDSAISPPDFDPRHVGPKALRSRLDAGGRESVFLVAASDLGGGGSLWAESEAEG